MSLFLFKTMDNILKEESPLSTPEGREWLRGILLLHTARIKFIKKDGSERVMNCTLKEDMIPLVEKKSEKVRAISDETLSVYDIDAEGWRSFRLDSVITLTIDL